MQNPEKISFTTIESFYKKCSHEANYDYEPYIDYDSEPDIIKSDYEPPLLNNTGLELFKDKNTLTFYIFNQTHDIIGYCSAFSYSIIINNTSCHELSVLIDPAYRRHGLGSMLVKQMLLTIDNNKTFTTSVTLVGTDEHFANNCGFDYSHSEHFMTRKPYNELDEQYKGNEKEFRRVTPSERYSPSQYPISVLCQSDSAPPRYLYRLDYRYTRKCRCCVHECSDYVNISDVFTVPKYRGKGYAGMLINYIALDFPQKKLLLQVAGNNTPAIHAYMKIGFTFLRTFDYYDMVLE